jgi:glycosyltransferase involved in cell wall biosynthesis
MESSLPDPSLLAISFAYPPFPSPRSVQVARLLRHVGRDVMLVHGREPSRDDPTLEPDAKRFLAACVCVPLSRSPWRRAVGSIAYRLRLPLWDHWPDAYRGWNRHALAAAGDLLARAPETKVAVTFGQPMSTHLLGPALRRSGLRWIAHWSDPWADNPFRRHDALTAWFDRKLEGRVVTEADRLVFVSIETSDLVMRKYPHTLRAKALVIPHAFDPRAYPNLAPQGSPLTIRHVGNFYEQRTPRPLFAALARLVQHDREAIHDLHVELIGSMQPSAMHGSGLDDLPPELVSVRSRVDYAESLALMKTAGALLIVDAPAERSVFLPSKLVDYVGARRPIFAMTPPGPAASLVRELGGTVADPSDPAAAAAALARFVRALRSSRSFGPWGDERVARRYEASDVGARFASIVDELAGRSRC